MTARLAHPRVRLWRMFAGAGVLALIAFILWCFVIVVPILVISGIIVP